MSASFYSLYSEPDIPANIFILLPAKDLCQVELVCNQWRDIVQEQSIWKKKLEEHYQTSSEWKALLAQHDWYPGVMLNHNEHKARLLWLGSKL